MRRRQPTISADRARELWNASSAGAESSEMLECSLATPMYGGGVAAGQVDKAMPIRASGIRGQLRFWWRLLNNRNGRLSPKDLFREERELWGGLAGGDAKASMVGLRVQGEPAGRRLRPKSELRLPSYGLILEPGEDPCLLQEGYAFKAVISFDDRLDEGQRGRVRECIRWWASFGGVGARTRRGFGAVTASAHEPVSVDEVQALGGWMEVGPAAANASDAWQRAIERLEGFRQAPHGRGGGKGPGRSNWPEADTIRRKAGQWSLEPKHSVDGFFPRAAFGLPIVFHFKDKSDPSDATLEPAEKHDRMASPLILRPYFDGQAHRPLALLLPGWKERIGVTVALRGAAAGKGQSVAAWPADADNRKRLADQIEPMRGRGEDVLSAFMHYFKAQRNRS